MARMKNEDQQVGRLPGTGGDFIDPQDTEGHKVSRVDGGERVESGATDGEPGPKFPDVEGDVEGHRASHVTRLYRGGPTTQGEIVMLVALLIVALAATLVPAWKASRVDPVDALRV